MPGIPIYLAFLFGGIALATAPAPSLSIVNEMRTSGPVTKTLIPMAALDDLVGAVIFFSVIAFVSANLSDKQIPVPLVLLLIFLPVFLGIATGWLTGVLLRRTHTTGRSLGVMVAMLFVSVAIGFFVNSLLPSPILNFLLLGMAFSIVIANMIPMEQLYGIMRFMNPVIGFSLVVVILNLGAPLDYRVQARTQPSILLCARWANIAVPTWVHPSPMRPKRSGTTWV